jgi:hypothetical protein
MVPSIQITALLTVTYGCRMKQETGKIKRGGELDDKALKLLKKSSGKQITLQVTYFTPDNERIKGGVSYQVSE